jgi:hypothetical protein
MEGRLDKVLWNIHLQQIDYSIHHWINQFLNSLKLNFLCLNNFIEKDIYLWNQQAYSKNIFYGVSNNTNLLS